MSPQHESALRAAAERLVKARAGVEFCCYTRNVAGKTPDELVEIEMDAAKARIELVEATAQMQAAEREAVGQANEASPPYHGLHSNVATQAIVRSP